MYNQFEKHLNIFQYIYKAPNCTIFHYINFKPMQRVRYFLMVYITFFFFFNSQWCITFNEKGRKSMHHSSFCNQFVFENCFSNIPLIVFD